MMTDDCFSIVSEMDAYNDLGAGTARGGSIFFCRARINNRM